MGRNATDKPTRYTKNINIERLDPTGAFWVKLNRAMANSETLYFVVLAKLPTGTANDPEGGKNYKTYKRAFEGLTEAEQFFKRAVADPWGSFDTQLHRISTPTDWGRVYLTEKRYLDRQTGLSTSVYLVTARCSKALGGNRVTERFDDLVEAETRAKLYIEEVRSVPYEPYTDRLEDARRVIALQRPKGAVTLSLVMAIASLTAPPLRSMSGPKAAEYNRNHFLKLARNHTPLPVSPNFGDISAYWRSLVEALLTGTFDSEGHIRKVSEDNKIAAGTLSKRKSLLKSVLKALTSRPEVFGIEYCKLLNTVPVERYWEEMLNSQKHAKAVSSGVHHIPLSASVVTRIILEELPNLRLQSHILKILCFGFRPDEAAKIDLTDLESDFINYERLISKTKYARGGTLEQPLATLGLRILLRADDAFKLRLAGSDPVWLKKEATFTRRQLRNTVAKHLEYFLKSEAYKVIKSRLGHTDLEMASSYYTKLQIADIKNQSATEYYELSPREGIKIGGKNIWDGEQYDWDRFVLTLILRAFSGGLVGDLERAQFVRIVTEEYDKRRGTQSADSVPLKKIHDYF